MRRVKEIIASQSQAAVLSLWFYFKFCIFFLEMKKMETSQQ